MEEGMDPRRGPPLMGGSRWVPGDMYHLGSSSGDSGSNNMSTGLRFNLPRRAPVPDSSMDLDLGFSSSSLLEQMPTVNQIQRSDSPLLAGGRVGGSPRHSDAGFGSSSVGDWAMHRYLENNTKSLLHGGSSTSRLDSRLCSCNLSRHSEQTSHLSPLPSQPIPLTMQVALHSTSPLMPSPSRPPPYPLSLRGRLQGSSRHSLLPPPSPLGPAPLRLPPSPPFDPLSFAPSIDSLPSPTTLFRGSLLHGSFRGGLHERGFMSASESLLGMPFRGLQMPTGDGGSQPCLVSEGFVEGSPRILMKTKTLSYWRDLNSWFANIIRKVIASLPQSANSFTQRTKMFLLQNANQILVAP